MFTLSERLHVFALLHQIEIYIVHQILDAFPQITA